MCLRKTVENRDELVGGNADSRITDGKANGSGDISVGIVRDANDNGTFVGKFESIADQIDQYLCQTGRVTDQMTRHIPIYMTGKLQTLLVGAHCHDIDGLVDDFVQVESDGFQLQATGFDFGKIQNIIDKI